MTGRSRPRLAMYWASACGGCEVAVLNLGERILLLDRFFEIAFFPCIADFKRSDLLAYPDRHIDVCLFNGAIRSTEDREMARLLRLKSRYLVAFGSCADEGCIPALINLSTTDNAFAAVYTDNVSTDSCDGVVPQPLTEVPEGRLALPVLGDTVRTLDQVEPVDYVVPGCPPEPDQVWSVLELFAQALASGSNLPPPGTVLGATEVAVCEECELTRTEKPITGFTRPHLLIPDPEVCLLDQGLVCLGVATRGGCGALCPKVGMGCRGCYGPPDRSADHGTRAVSAMAAVVGVGSPHDDEAALGCEVEAAMATLVDPVGTLYRFSLARSMLRRARTTGQDNGDLQGHEEDQH